MTLLMIRLLAAQMLALCLALGSTATGWRVLDPETTPEPGPVAPGEDAPDPADLPRSFDSADDLLTALEDADKGLATLRATLRYTRTFALQGDTQTRTGRVYFDGGLEPLAGEESERLRRRVAIEFDDLIVGSRRTEQPKQYIFDGEWLVERMPDERRFVRQQVVPPGETFDPLRFGEGPFPVPIGQKREDILERFEAELREPTDGLEGSLAERFSEDRIQLRLVPRPEFAEDEDLVEIRVWYETETLLPRLARTTNAIGDESYVELFQVRANTAIDPGVFDTSRPPEDEGWDVEIRPWRGRVSGE